MNTKKNEICDKMILAVIQGDDYTDAVKVLNEHGFYATVLHSSGGFLKKKSVTVMIGLNHERLEEALQILKSYGEHTMTQYEPVIPTGSEMSPFTSTIPVQVRHGGVVLFVLDIERHERY